MVIPKGVAPVVPRIADVAVRVRLENRSHEVFAIPEEIWNLASGLEIPIPIFPPLPYIQFPILS